VLRGYLVDERADSPERQSRYRVSPEQAEQALGGDGGGDNGSVGGDGGGLGGDGGEKKQAASDEIGL